MVFVLQATQNRDNAAIETKLDAILEAIDKIPNSLMGIEELSEAEIKKIHQGLIDDGKRTS
jgi:low affinity Fe/Cu permease